MGLIYVGQNELGYTWWLDENLTEYARKKLPKDYWVAIVKRPEQTDATLLCKLQRIIMELPSSLEGACTKIDIFAFNKKENEAQEVR
jgi:hypothetical protein